MALALRSVTHPPSKTERELVAAVRDGDDSAFEELFSRYRRRITAYIARMVGDYPRAEDLTQDVFIAALRRIRETERSVSFKPWIYEIAKNACIDEYRRLRRNEEVSIDDEESPGAEVKLMASGPTPDAALENKQDLENLFGAISSLSENQHQILVMRELEGLSYGDIAKRTGTSRSVVESSLFRARRRLNKEFKELSSGRRCEQVQGVIDNADAHSPRLLGLRERRQVSRHLSYCHACRYHARMAGVDESLFRAPRFVDKIAALLPIPWLRERGRFEKPVFQGSGAHSMLMRAANNASQLAADPLSSPVALGQAAAAVAAIAAIATATGSFSGSGQPVKASVASRQKAAIVASPFVWGSQKAILTADPGRLAYSAVAPIAPLFAGPAPASNNGAQHDTQGVVPVTNSSSPAPAASSSAKPASGSSGSSSSSASSSGSGRGSAPAGGSGGGLGGAPVERPPIVTPNLPNGPVSVPSAPNAPSVSVPSAPHSSSGSSGNSSKVTVPQPAQGATQGVTQGAQGAGSVVGQTLSGVGGVGH